MVDSGATTTFINKKFIEKNRVRTRKLCRPIQLYNIDRSENAIGRITEVFVTRVEIGKNHQERVVFSVADIGPQDAIIRIDWLRTHNPDIDWEGGTLRLSRCPDSCQASRTRPPSVVEVRRDSPIRKVLSRSPIFRPLSTLGRSPPVCFRSEAVHIWCGLGPLASIPPWASSVLFGLLSYCSRSLPFLLLYSARFFFPCDVTTCTDQ